MATATHNTGALSTEQFHLTGEYRALSKRQRIWVDSFIEFQDIERATTAAYGENDNDSYTRMLSSKNETNRRIVAALNVYYGRSPREALLLELERTISMETGNAKVRAMALYASLKFGVEDSQPTAEDTDAPEGPETALGIRGMRIGDIVLVDGMKHKVTTVDENGRPTEGDPL